MNKSTHVSAFWWFTVPVATLAGLLMAMQLPGDFYPRFIDGELGLLETTHFLVPLASALFGAWLLTRPEVRRDRLLRGWLVLLVVGSIYIGGEEASWGQHYFDWKPSESWQAINDQAETNLHNTSSWFDQKPRTLLEIGVILGGILLPIWLFVFGRIPSFGRLDILMPAAIALPTALIGEGIRLVERLDLAGNAWFPIGVRYSEIQEFYFYWFILLYLLTLHARVTQKQAVPALEPVPQPTGQLPAAGTFRSSGGH